MTSSNGDCIITAGTIALGSDGEDKIGLAENHCYCICRVELLMLIYGRWRRLMEIGYCSYAIPGVIFLGKESSAIKTGVVGLLEFV